MRRFFSPPENITQGQVHLGYEETRHLRDVLRLKSGDAASVFDGRGREYLCRIEQLNRKEAVLKVERETGAGVA